MGLEKEQPSFARRERRTTLRALSLGFLFLARFCSLRRRGGTISGRSGDWNVIGKDTQRNENQTTTKK